MTGTLYYTNMSLKNKTKRRKTYGLQLTKFELLHLRDLMSVSLPPSGEQTLSQALATVEERPVVESFLWRKLCELCQDADLPVGDEAPDYIVAPVGVPQIGVFMIASDPPDPSVLGSESFLPPSNNEG